MHNKVPAKNKAQASLFRTDETQNPVTISKNTRQDLNTPIRILNEMEGLKLHGGAIELSPQENGYKKPILNAYRFGFTTVTTFRITSMYSISRKLLDLKTRERSVQGCNRF